MEYINTNGSLRATNMAPSVNIAFMVMIFLSILTVITNALILLAFYVERRLQTYSNQYIVNIAISDLLVGLVCMPLRSTIVLYEQGWPFGNTIGIVFYGFQNIVLSVSVFGVIAICFDRYIATFYPIKHYQVKSKRKAFIVNISTWIISISIWVPLNIVWDLLYPSDKAGNSGYPLFNVLLHSQANIVVAFVRFFGPFLIISILYLKIYFRLRIAGSKHLMEKFEKQRQSNKFPVMTQTQRGTHDTSFNVTNSESDDDGTKATKEGHVSVISFRETLRSAAYQSTSVPEESGVSAGKPVIQHVQGDSFRSSEAENTPKYSGSCNAKNPPGKSPVNIKKGMRTLSFVVLAFFITWLPNCANVIIAFVSADFYQTISTYTEVARWATFLNSLMNPVGYALAQPLFRQTISRILSRS